METAPQKPIRVLQLCEHFGTRNASFHGVARSFELWIPALNKPPFEVFLCSRAQATPAAIERFRRVGVEPMSLGYSRLDPRNLWKLIRILREKKIDILHLHGYGACTWGRLAGHLLGIPAIVHERCNYRTVPWFQRPVEWVLGPFTRYAFAVSESTRLFTIRKRHIPAARVKLLYSGIPLDAVPQISLEEQRRSRRTLGVEDDTFLMGIVGRLEPHKGHADVFYALRRMGVPMAETKLWIIGDGYYQAELERLAREAGLEKAVTFMGYQADVWPLIQALDLQIFPSHREGTPNTLYEAMAVGNTLLASTADGQGEILRRNRDALMFTPGDVVTLSRHLLRLYGEPVLRRSLGEAAKERIKEFDMVKTMDTLRKTYLDIMEKQR
ncbi:MAG: glycosyltransferase [Verrucomicrobiota bacterium]|jgi:glycosyltransferase involved in cell wall biosynthesis|nr:glycosyltransferase [Verrucomicrobiota bacterium]